MVFDICNQLSNNSKHLSKISIEFECKSDENKKIKTRHIDFAVTEIVQVSETVYLEPSTSSTLNCYLLWG